MFNTLPINDAFEWVRLVHGGTVEKRLRLAKQFVKEGDIRNAHALARISGASGKGICRGIESQAMSLAAELYPCMQEQGNHAWVVDFLTFRRNYAFTEAAQPLLKHYERLRKQHESMGEKLWFQARDLFGKNRRNAKAVKICQEIVDKYYCSSFYRYARAVLEGQ